MRRSNLSRIVFARLLLLALVLAPSSWALATDFLFDFEFDPDGTLIISDTGFEADFAADIGLFQPFNLAQFIEHAIFAAGIAADLSPEAEQGFLDLLDDADKIGRAAGVGTPFGVFAQTATFNDESAEIDLVVALNAALNSDPFIGFEGTFTNNGSAPLDLDLGFDLAIDPIATSAPSTIDTMLSAELTSAVGATDSPTDVFAFHTLTASPTPGSPEIRTTFNSEIAVDLLSDIAPGVEATDETDDFDFAPIGRFGPLGGDDAVFAMSSFLAIDELQPGDTLNVQFGFSLGTQDGSVPLAPAEGILFGFDQGLFVPVPEPSAVAIALVLSALPILGRFRA